MDDPHTSADIICNRCHNHTGNNSQGHYWSWCKILKDFAQFHFCCPGDCELYPQTKPENG